MLVKITKIRKLSFKLTNFETEPYVNGCMKANWLAIKPDTNNCAKRPRYTVPFPALDTEPITYRNLVSTLISLLVSVRRMEG